MLLQHAFDNPEVNLSLELFLREINGFFGDDLLSVVVFGSILFNDLAPGYGDLDFTAVIERDLEEDDLQRLIDLRKPLRSGCYGVYCHMIEGPFLPKRMLDPLQTGKTICWGTSKERVWEKNQLGWFIHHLIHEHGVIIYGQDIRPILPRPTREQLITEAGLACRDIKEHGLGSDNPHCVDWLLLAARTLLWLKEDRFDSKSGAADWAFINAQGRWKEHLPLARDVRRNPSLAASPDVQKWLRSLTDLIREAAEELEQHLQIMDTENGR